MKQRRVTMADIAAKVGVSRIAVSMALRDHHRISIERRRQIRRAAREMGFVPDPFLSALAAHRQQRVTATEHGVLAWINHWKDPKRLRQFKEFDLYWRGAGEAAVEFGYRVDEIRWESDCSPKRLEKFLLARGIEGVLIPPHHDLLHWIVHNTASNTFAVAISSNATLSVVTPAGIAEYWNVAGAGTWDTVTANWSTDQPGANSAVWTNGNDAIFSSANGSSGQFDVTVDSGGVGINNRCSPRC